MIWIALRRSRLRSLVRNLEKDCCSRAIGRCGFPCAHRTDCVGNARIASWRLATHSVRLAWKRFPAKVPCQPWLRGFHKRGPPEGWAPQYGKVKWSLAAMTCRSLSRSKTPHPSCVLRPGVSPPGYFSKWVNGMASRFVRAGEQVSARKTCSTGCRAYRLD